MNCFAFSFAAIFSVAPSVLSAILQRFDQLSYQLGRSCGELMLPSGFVVMYVFSLGRGSRGVGATMKKNM